MSARNEGIGAALVACVVFLAVPASAVDGEILIDQAKVEAGGITPGDSPGFPATLSRAGRYKLTGNLKVPAEVGIQVTQNNVTIDLNGFTISSDPPGAALYAVSAISVSGLRVLNGTIAGFKEYAIYNVGGASLVVENMRMVSNRRGVTGSQCRIRNSTIANGEIGLNVALCLIERNLISGNSLHGILVSEGMVLGNAIVGSGSHGLNNLFSSQVGYGANLLFGNNAGGPQVSGNVVQAHPNFCEPACP